MTRLSQIQGIRRKLATDGPPRVRSDDGDFDRVSLPERDCDALRDLLIAERANTVIEIGLAYGSSALAIGEALVSVGGEQAQHLILDPFQHKAFRDAGWDMIRAAGHDSTATLVREQSQYALPRLVADGLVADAAFVDGSHIFHHVFVDLYFLRSLVRPNGLVILDDHSWPSVASAARYFETNLGWTPEPVNGTPGRMRALRLPEQEIEVGFKDFTPF